MKEKQPRNDQNSNMHSDRDRSLKNNKPKQDKKMKDDEYIVSGTGNRLGNVLKVDRG